MLQLAIITRCKNMSFRKAISYKSWPRDWTLVHELELFFNSPFRNHAQRNCMKAL